MRYRGELDILAGATIGFLLAFVITADWACLYLSLLSFLVWNSEINDWGKKENK